MPCTQEKISTSLQSVPHKRRNLDFHSLVEFYHSHQIDLAQVLPLDWPILDTCRCVVLTNPSTGIAGYQAS